MLEFFAIFTTSFTVALSGALMPGPLLTVTISESARRGYMAGPLLIVGHSVLELVLVTAICLGLDVYLKEEEYGRETQAIFPFQGRQGAFRLQIRHEAFGNRGR